MNPVTVLVGAAAIGYGLYTGWARRARPEQLGKLEAMKRSLGERNGQLVHLVAYTVVPIVVGVALVLGGLRGVGIGAP
jgi:TRAP-type mannitol/chloroaromatic compound transport system permease large subunit